MWSAAKPPAVEAGIRASKISAWPPVGRRRRKSGLRSLTRHHQVNAALLIIPCRSAKSVASASSTQSGSPEMATTVFCPRNLALLTKAHELSPHSTVGRFQHSQKRVSTAEHGRVYFSQARICWPGTSYLLEIIVKHAEEGFLFHQMPNVRVPRVCS